MDLKKPIFLALVFAGCLSPAASGSASDIVKAELESDLVPSPVEYAVLLRKERAEEMALFLARTLSPPVAPSDARRESVFKRLEAIKRQYGLKDHYNDR